MSNTLLYETFLFGNLELLYTRRKLKNIELNNFIEILNNNETDFGINWGWRFYKNYKFLYSTYENNIITDKEIGIFFINLLEAIITLAKKINTNLDCFDDIENDNIAVLILLRELEERLKNISIFNESNNITSLQNLFDKKFNYILNQQKDCLTLLDYILPYEKNNWSPSWCVTIDDKAEIVAGIDIHIDYYFLFPDIRFNNHMIKDITALTKRLQFLQEKAKNYYNKVIEEKINYLTKNIFNSYPYKIIYEDYLILAKKYEQVYLPPILKYFNLDKINNDIWLLSILPKYLTAYLLGFAIISSDVPNEKNLSKVIEKILDVGVHEYWQEIYQINNTIINLKSMHIDCGNNKEENKILDLTYSSVDEYNIDDTFLFFNEGVFYVFTYPEFEDLINKERNPYNRNVVPLMTSMISAIKFKKKLKRQLNYRYLEANLNSTMEENFNTIKKSLSEDNNFTNSTTNYHNFTNSLINMFLSNSFYSN